MSITKLSTYLYWLLILPLIVIPLIWVFYVFSIDSFKELLIDNASYTIQWQTVEKWQLFSLCFISFIPSAILLWGIVNLRRTFKAFSLTHVFELSNVQHVKHFALALILVPLLNTVVNTLASLLLSVNHPAGQKVLSISLNSYDVSTLLIGLVFWLIAKILVKATELSEENKEFV